MALSVPQFTRRNLIIAGCCLGLSITAIGLGPVLQLYQKGALDNRISDTRKRVEVLGRAADMRQMLQERIKGLQDENIPQPVVAGKLASEQADQVLADLRKLADRVGLQLADVRPDLKSLGQNSKSMSIGVTLYGSMGGFQKLLNGLLQTPYVDRVQRLLVSAEPEGLQLETDFTVHIQ